MKILNVNATLDPISGGGTAERLFQLSRFLAKAGAECRVLTLDLGLTRERLAAMSDFRIITLRCICPRFYLFALPDPRISEAVAWADMILLMGHWTLINAIVYHEAKKLNKPYIFCPAGALPIFGRSRLLKILYNNLIGRRIAEDAAACVAIGTNEVEHFRHYGIGPDRVTVIPNGVNPAEFVAGDAQAFRAKSGIGDAPFVLFMGRLNPIKGPDLLLEAFGKIGHVFPDIHLVFAGPDDGLLRSLRHMAQKSGLASRTHFLGHVSGEYKAGAYRAARLLAIPSRQEAMSIVALESGICRTPVLITDQCGFAQIKEAGGGRIVPASVEGIKSGLLDMLSNPEQLLEMGKRIESYTRSHFLWEAVAAYHLKLFNRVLGEKTAS